MVSARRALQIPSFIIALIGTIINFVALATPAWQVVYVRELQQWIQSGLWMNCQTRPSGMISCTYTFTKTDIDFYTNPQVISIRTPAFYALINIGCNIAFQIFAHMLEYRFYHVSVSGIYEAYQYRHPQEDFFAMRALPELPQKYRK
ncbi:unnamed protein product [Acanthocheilonema viteae]|uniref:Claudin n=1 Tax=Acanthocheilonema viteae TaxID=6277 RepID=A0A498SFM5_ACAVI|nr:unnamed protein product [Acanthocheilonema viteae]